MTPDVRQLKRKKRQSNESSSDEDTPLASTPAKRAASGAVRMNGALEATTTKVSTSNGRTKAAKKEADADGGYNDSGDDVPLTKGKRATNGKGTRKPPRKKVKKEESPGSDSDDDKPIAKKAPAREKRKVKDESDADDESLLDDDKSLKKPPAKKAATRKMRAEKSGSEAPARQKKTVKEKSEETEASPKKGRKKEEEEEEVFRWWEQGQDPNGDGTQKWQTLEHNGVYFPPPYEPLPANVKMKYNGT